MNVLNPDCPMISSQVDELVQNLKVGVHLKNTYYDNGVVDSPVQVKSSFEWLYLSPYSPQTMSIEVSKNHFVNREGILTDSNLEGDFFSFKKSEMRSNQKESNRIDLIELRISDLNTSYHASLYSMWDF